MQSSVSSTPASTSSLSQPWKLRICPKRPFNEVPFLLSCSPSTSLLSLRERIATVLQKYTEVRIEHVQLFISSDGTNFALVEDGPIRDLLQNGERIEVQRDEALWTRESSETVLSSIGKHTREDDDEAEIMLEANRIAQKIKSEIGLKTNQNDDEKNDPAWPSPPIASKYITAGPPSSVSMSLPPITSLGAASALKAFEERKRLMNSSTRKAVVQQSKSLPSEASTNSSSSSSSSSLSPSSSSSDSSSSSSSASSSDSSSNDSSSSSASSSSSDSSSSDSSEAPAEVPVRASISQDWVPPGEGLARTQRNNRSRRQKRKRKEDEMKEKLFQEAKARSEKRQNGEAIDEEAAERAWMVDTRGTKRVGQIVGKQRYAVVARDAELVLPPGGGSFGIEQKKKAAKRLDASASTSKNDQVEGVTGTTNLSQDVAEKKKASDFKTAKEIYNNVGNATQESKEDYSRYPPPPSLRTTAIPAGVKLTSVDCDQYYNTFQDQTWSSALQEETWINEDTEDVNEAYAAFQAKAKASLRAAKEKEERELLEEEARRLTASNGDDTDEELEEGWLDGDNLWEKDLPDEIDHKDGIDCPYEVDDENMIGLGSLEGESVTPFHNELPQAFGKKADWDGNEVVVHSKIPQSAAPALSSIEELDYGDPDDAISHSRSSLPEVLKELRDLRDKTRAAKVREANGSEDSLQKARLAALATRKRQNDAKT